MPGWAGLRAMVNAKDPKVALEPRPSKAKMFPENAPDRPADQPLRTAPSRVGALDTALHIVAGGSLRPSQAVAPGLLAAGDHVEGPYPATLAAQCAAVGRSRSLGLVFRETFSFGRVSGSKRNTLGFIFTVFPDPAHPGRPKQPMRWCCRLPSDNWITRKRSIWWWCRPHAPAPFWPENAIVASCSWFKIQITRCALACGIGLKIRVGLHNNIRPTALLALARKTPAPASAPGCGTRRKNSGDGPLARCVPS